MSPAYVPGRIVTEPLPEFVTVPGDPSVVRIWLPEPSTRSELAPTTTRLRPYPAGNTRSRETVAAGSALELLTRSSPIRAETSTAATLRREQLGLLIIVSSLR